MARNTRSGIRVQPSRLRVLALALPAFVCLILLWYGYSAYLAVSNPELAHFVPSPWEVASTAIDMLGSTRFWQAALHSNLRVIVSFVISLALALPLGLWLGAYPCYKGIAGPITDFGRYIPIAAVVPLGILWFGTGESLKVFVLFLGVFFQLVVMITDNVRRVSLEYVEGALTLGARPRQVVLSVLLPAAAPSIYDSLRVGVGFCWTYLMIAEIVAPEHGLGHIINYSQRFLRTAEIFVVIIVLGLFGLAYDYLFVWSRRRLFPWVVADRSAS